jgi:hypothetical protein
MGDWEEYDYSLFIILENNEEYMNIQSFFSISYSFSPATATILDINQTQPIPSLLVLFLRSRAQLASNESKTKEKRNPENGKTVPLSIRSKRNCSRNQGGRPRKHSFKNSKACRSTRKLDPRNAPLLVRRSCPRRAFAGRDPAKIDDTPPPPNRSEDGERAARWAPSAPGTTSRADGTHGLEPAGEWGRTKGAFFLGGVSEQANAKLREREELRGGEGEECAAAATLERNNNS